MSVAPLVYLAPFQSITTHTFRQVYTRHFRQVSKFYTPYFAKIDHDTKLSARKEQQLQHLENSSAEVVPQILSKDAAEIVRFARICAGLGFKELNWNLGCPYPQVANKRRGSGLLPFPETVREILGILETVTPSLPLRLSVKCRLGYESKEEIYPLLSVFNDYPLHELTVHGRIGKQLYAGTVDHSALASIAPLLKMPLVHNGDIRSTDDYTAVSELLPSVNRWMIGRGVLINPFLPEEIYGLASADKRKRLQSFMDDLFTAYLGDMDRRHSILSVLKEYWDYLGQGFDDPVRVNRLIKKAKTFEEYEIAVRRVFEEC